MRAQPSSRHRRHRRDRNRGHRGHRHRHRHRDRHRHRLRHRHRHRLRHHASTTAAASLGPFITLAFVMFVVLASLVTTAHADRRRDTERQRDEDRVVHDDRVARDVRDEHDVRDERDERDPDVEVEVDVDLDLAPDGTAGASVIGRSRPPAVAEVLEAAYEAAGLDRDPARSWSRRARVAGLVPWMSVRTGWNASWQEDEPDVGRSRTFEVRATWRLDRLVFDPRELQVASVEAARRRERRQLANQVIRSYFAWRKVSALAAHDPRFALAAEAATAQLDALTDGWFSDRGNSGK